MTGDVQTLTIGTVPYTIQVAVDRLAATLEGYAGWAIRVDIDPGVVLVATPAVQEEPS